MKRRLMLLLTSALLIGNLTACGCSSKDAGSASGDHSTETAQPSDSSTGQANDSITDSSTHPGTGTDGANTGDGSTIGSGESLLEDAGDALRDGAEDIGDAVTGHDSADSGVAIDDMLRNGRIRSN